MASIIIPPQKRTNLDVIQQGLQVASALYGIRTDMAKVDSYKLDQQRSQMQLDEAKDAQAGIMPQSKVAELALSGAQVVDPNTEGAVKVNVRDRTSGEVKPIGIIPVKTGKYSTVGGKGGEIFVLNEGTGTLKDTGVVGKDPDDPGGFKHADFIDKIQTEFNDKYVKDPLQKYDNAQTVKNLAALNDPIADRYLNTTLVPMLSGMNRMNETEIRNSGGSPSLLNQAEQFLIKAKSGETYTPEDRASIMKLADVFQNHAKMQVVKSGHDFASQKADVLHMTKGEIYDRYLKPDELFRDRQGQTLEDFTGGQPTVNRSAPKYGQFYSQPTFQLENSAQGAPGPAPAFDPTSYLKSR